MVGVCRGLLGNVTAGIEAIQARDIFNFVTMFGHYYHICIIAIYGHV